MQTMGRTGTVQFRSDPRSAGSSRDSKSARECLRPGTAWWANTKKRWERERDGKGAQGQDKNNGSPKWRRRWEDLRTWERTLQIRNCWVEINLANAVGHCPLTADMHLVVIIIIICYWTRSNFVQNYLEKYPLHSPACYTYFSFLETRNYPHLSRHRFTQFVWNFK